MKRIRPKTQKLASIPQVIELAPLANALDFAGRALDELNTDCDPGRLKYAVLHLSAAVELVLKDRLKREHWSLVFSNPDQASKVAFERGEFTSVTMDVCINRLNGICGIALDEKTVRELQNFRKLRNKLEHFGIRTNSAALKASLSKVLDIWLEFIDAQFDSRSLDVDEAAMLDDIRHRALEFDKFIERRMNKLKPELDAANCVVECPNCRQRAWMINSGEDPRCGICGTADEPESAATAYVSDVLGLWEDPRDGGGPLPVYECPECERECLVPADETRTTLICFQCAQSWKAAELEFCVRCGRPFEAEDDELACGTCFADYMARD